MVVVSHTRVDASRCLRWNCAVFFVFLAFLPRVSGYRAIPENRWLHVLTISRCRILVLSDQAGTSRRTQSFWMKGLNGWGDVERLARLVGQQLVWFSVQTRITSYFAYRFAGRDIAINWQSRGDIYDSRMAPLATVLYTRTVGCSIGRDAQRLFDFVPVEIHLLAHWLCPLPLSPSLFLSLFLCLSFLPNEFGLVNLPGRLHLFIFIPVLVPSRQPNPKFDLTLARQFHDAWNFYLYGSPSHHITLYYIPYQAWIPLRQERPFSQ